MKNIKILLLILFSHLISAQERVVFGVVKDSTGVLAGANVLIKGKLIGTQTDFDGKYSIKATANDTLIFSYVESKTQKIRADKNEINVILQYIDNSNDCIYEDNSYYQVRRKETSFAYQTNDYKKPSKKDLRIAKRAEKASKRDLKNKDNPKYNFKKVKNNGYIIYKKDNCYYKKDQDFQQKYHIGFSLLPYLLSKEYAEKYNKLVFKHLNKKFKKAWQKEIRKDIFGLDNFLK